MIAQKCPRKYRAFNCGPFRPISLFCGIHSYVVVAALLGTGLSAFDIGRLAFPAVGGGRRRFGGVASTSVANLCFSGPALVLWDDRNGCSGPRSRLSESARAGSVAGV